jgi:hypothetical protein
MWLKATTADGNPVCLPDECDIMPCRHEHQPPQPPSSLLINILFIVLESSCSSMIAIGEQNRRKENKFKRIWMPSLRLRMH